MKNTRIAQRGFTLLELLVVVAIIAILASIAVPAFRDGENPSKATAMITSAERITQSLRQISKSCAISSAVTSNPLPATGKTLSDVIFVGSTNVASAYTNCYNQSLVKPLTDLSEPSATAGTYNVQGFDVSLSGGGTSAISVAFSSVPDELVLMMAQHFNSALTALATSDTTSPILRYTTATNGVRTVTIIKQ